MLSHPSFNHPSRLVLPQLMPWRVVCFFCGLILYACAGSPTPDAMGWVEVVVALLMLPAARLPRLTQVPAAAGALLLYGLTIPVLGGLAVGHQAVMILRDLVPFLFLLLPLFYTTLLRHHPTGLVVALTVAGFIFSVRTLLPYQGVMDNPLLWFGRPPADLLYLANSPEVLFSALLLAGGGGLLIRDGRSLIGGTLMMAAALVPVLAMAVMTQRAGLGCVVMAAAIWAGTGLLRQPVRLLPVLIVLLLLLGPLLEPIGLLIRALAYKSELVGLNSRAQEWGTVLGLVGATPWTALFGLGWGAVFENPAVANLPVNYTHSLISALLLKTGLAGAGLGLVYLWSVAKQAVPDIVRRPILMISLALPLAVGLFLYASYKSLGFGLLLLLLALVPAYRKLDQKQSPMP